MKSWNAFFYHSISHPRPQSSFVNQTQQQFCKANGLGSKELETAVLELLVVMKEPETELKQCTSTWPSWSPPEGDISTKPSRSPSGSAAPWLHAHAESLPSKDSKSGRKKRWFHPRRKSREWPMKCFVCVEPGGWDGKLQLLCHPTPLFQIFTGARRQHQLSWGHCSLDHS